MYRFGSTVLSVIFFSFRKLKAYATKHTFTKNSIVIQVIICRSNFEKITPLKFSECFPLLYIFFVDKIVHPNILSQTIVKFHIYKMYLFYLTFLSLINTLKTIDNIFNFTMYCSNISKLMTYLSINMEFETSCGKFYI